MDEERLLHLLDGIIEVLGGMLERIRDLESATYGERARKEPGESMSLKCYMAKRDGETE